MFARDVDLLVYEPRLFHNIAWAGQRLLDAESAGTINAAGDRLTVNGASFADWQVEPGWVVIVGDTPLEVIERLSDTQLRVSRPRLVQTEPLIRADAGSGLRVRLHTFRHQRHEAARAILRLLDLAYSADAGPGEADENAITNPASLRRAEVFGALGLIFLAAAPDAPDAETWQNKAHTWCARFRIEMSRVSIGIDLAGEGLPTETRHTNTRCLERG